MNPPDELKLMKSGERAIVFNPDSGDVLFSDFHPAKTPADGEVRLSHIVDMANEIGVLQIVSAAIGRPGMMVESDCAFRGAPVHLRVLYSASPEPRTCVFISPRS